MIGYVNLGTNDLVRAARFYDAISDDFGFVRCAVWQTCIGWGSSAEGPAYIFVSVPFDKAPATAGNGTMIALKADGKDQVDRIYRIALAHGGTDEGAPGLRGDGFYAAYFRDPDGNKLNVFAYV